MIVICIICLIISVNAIIMYSMIKAAVMADRNIHRIFYQTQVKN